MIDLVRGAHFLRPFLPPLRAAFEDHLHGDDEQHDPARDTEGVEFDVQRGQQRLAEQGEQQQDQERDGGCADRHPLLAARARLAHQAGEDRRAARRIDHHEQRDEGRGEEFEHLSPSPRAEVARLACRHNAPGARSSPSLR